MLETISPVHFLLIDSAALKQAISDHCAMFSTKLSDLLRKLAHNKIDHIYEYTVENAAKLVSSETFKLLSDEGLLCFTYTIFYLFF